MNKNQEIDQIKDSLQNSFAKQNENPQMSPSPNLSAEALFPKIDGYRRYDSAIRQAKAYRRRKTFRLAAMAAGFVVVCLGVLVVINPLGLNSFLPLSAPAGEAGTGDTGSASSFGAQETLAPPTSGAGSLIGGSGSSSAMSTSSSATSSTGSASTSSFASSAARSSAGSLVDSTAANAPKAANALLFGDLPSGGYTFDVEQFSAAAKRQINQPFSFSTVEESENDASFLRILAVPELSSKAAQIEIGRFYLVDLLGKSQAEDYFKADLPDMTATIILEKNGQIIYYLAPNLGTNLSTSERQDLLSLTDLLKTKGGEFFKGGTSSF